jgi:pullulanase
MSQRASFVAGGLRSIAMLLASCPVAVASDDTTATADCAGPAFERVLHAAPHHASDARAIWLSPTRVRWPGKPEDSHYRLAFSPSASVVARSGAPVEGAERSPRLPVASDALPASVAARFRHVGAGVTLALDAVSADERRDWLRGQLLLVQEDARGDVLDATHLQTPGAIDTLYAKAVDADDLGVRASPDATTFALWAPTARAVALCLHRADGDRVVPMQRDEASGIWRARLDTEHEGEHYRYLVDVFVPGVGLVRNRVTDPYSISLDTDSQRSWIGSLDAPATQPEGWDDAPLPAPLAHPTQMVIYELHVRDFSIDDDRVPPELRGKYGAFAVADSRGMRHLRALRAAGLTDVHLLPVFDLASVPETGCVTPVLSGAPDAETQQAAVFAVRDRDCFNWGYDPWHYTAPEGSYARDPHDGAARIREFRTMVMGLHRAGLRVGMDVVYNHTTASGQHPKSVLDRIVPGYYHRLDATGRVERSTSCDKTATQHAMMAKLMLDSAVTWARDYRIDSFRFDLMGHQPRAAMLALQRAVDTAAGRPVELIGEGWNFGEVADGARFVQAAQGELDGTGIATFSDRARDAARGGGCCDTGADVVARQGWLNGLHYAPNAEAAPASARDLMHAADLLRVGLAGTLRDYTFTAAAGARVAAQQIRYGELAAGYASAPGEVVNYVENHDNLTLFDLNAMKLPRATSREDRARVQLLGAALVAFSQGIAYYHAGIDLLRSKSLDRNSFDSGDGFNRIDWAYRTNHFGSGLPPRAENESTWPWMRPRLADASIAPGPAEIASMRDGFRDLLRVRASSTVFRLRSAAEVQARLRFPNSGPAQIPTLIVGHLDGRGLEGAGFDAAMYFLHAGLQTQELTMQDEQGQAWVLHPVHRAPHAADPRAAEARFDPVQGRFTIPPRTAVVFVREATADADARAGARDDG